MPHYVDGTEAKVGDFVTGKPYNTDHVVAGTVVSISPETDSCNMEVAYLEVVPAPAVGSEVLYKTRRMNKQKDLETRGNQNHGSAGDQVTTVYCRDYAAVKEFTKIA